ncbi:hypothetical protein BJX61DRAFT_335147 [Aspergillus egyptiacus]|nr:hypothetical protein BJX61DRAFT_335147 [Aspergillus egyptiacus]
MSTATSLSPSKPTLTTNDSAVLQALFDAESSPSSAITIDPSLPPLPSSLNISAQEHEYLQSREREIISTLSSTPNPSIQTIQDAIEALDALVKSHPSYPSAYANRAQALRILLETSPTSESAISREGQEQQEGKEPTTIFTEQNTPLLSTLLSDLGKAISLSKPPSPASPVSPLQARLLADAHTHRAYLLLRVSRYLKSKPNGEGVPANLKEVGGGPEGLEEMASRDFFFGGRYGNRIAQQMAVQTNPYAKMCGAIVKEALRKEVEGGKELAG